MGCLCCVVVLVLHVMSCGWYWVGALASDSSLSWVDMYHDSDVPISKRSIVFQYALSLSWSLGLLGLGWADVHPLSSSEAVYAVVATALSLVAVPTLAAKVITVVVQRNKSAGRARARGQQAT